MVHIIQPHKKNGILSFAATWVDSEIMILTYHNHINISSFSDRERQTLYDTTYMRNLILKKLQMHLYTK